MKRSPQPIGHGRTPDQVDLTAYHHYAWDAVTGSGDCALTYPQGAAERDDRLRLVVRQWERAALIRLALEGPLRFASAQSAVPCRVAGLLREVARGASGAVRHRGAPAHPAGRRRGRRVRRRPPDDERSEWVEEVEVAAYGPLARTVAAG